MNSLCTPTRLNSYDKLIFLKILCRHEFAMKYQEDPHNRSQKMNQQPQLDAEQLRKIREDILDSIDEELEMALEDGVNENDPLTLAEDKVARAHYFRELWLNYKIGL
jgi:hypothetical protein